MLHLYTAQLASKFRARKVTQTPLELLDDTIRLTHPDCHPPERQELAKRVTQQFLALKPFTFPAPKPKPIVTSPCNASSKGPGETSKEPLRKATSYPCKECKSTIPYYYCTACRAELNKRREEERAGKQQSSERGTKSARRGVSGK